MTYRNEFPWQEGDIGIEIHHGDERRVFARKAEVFNCREGSYLIVDDIVIKKRTMGQRVPFLFREETYGEKETSCWIPMKKVNKIYHCKSEEPEWTQITKEEATEKLEEQLAQDAEGRQQQQPQVEESSDFKIILCITGVVLGLTGIGFLVGLCF